MADIEKARELLREIVGNHTRFTNSIYHKAIVALRALDDDGAEEWSARTTGDLHRMDGWPIIANSHAIAVCGKASDAERFARLPALERAAEDVIKTASCAHKLDVYVQVQHRTVNALRSALNQEGQ